MALPDGVSLGIFIGFIICASYNIFGVLFTSKFFTSKEFFQVYPEAFSRTGCIAIMLWGLAYLSICTSYRDTPYTILLFVLEKFVYVVIYAVFLRHQSKDKEHSLGMVFQKDPLAGMFYSFFGLGDFASMVFFLGVFIHVVSS